MLRPTYFIGVGELGGKLIDMIKTMSFMLTQDATFLGLFRYHRVYHLNEIPGFEALKDLFFDESNEARTKLNIIRMDNRNSVLSDLKNNRMDEFPNIPDGNLWEDIKPSENRRLELVRTFQGKFGMEYVPLSTNREIFIIGDIGELVTSVAIPLIAKSIYRIHNIKPYGFLFLPDGSDKDSAKRAYSFLYEMYSSYSPGGTPWFEAAYLAHRGQSGGSVEAETYTAARFLILTQTIVDVPGKLIDVSSDEGRGNVLAWALRGYRTGVPEERLSGALVAVRDYLGDWTDIAEKNKIRKVIEEFISDVIMGLEKQLDVKELPEDTGAVKLIEPEKVESTVRDTLWHWMFFKDSPQKLGGSGPSLATGILQTAQEYTTNAVDKGLWKDWKPDAIDDSGVKAFYKAQRQIMVKFSEFLGSDHSIKLSLLREYRKMLAVSSWKNHEWTSDGDFMHTYPTLGEVNNFMDRTRASIKEAIDILQNTLSTQGVWDVGKAEFAAVDGIVSKMILGPGYTGNVLVDVKDWGDFLKYEKIVIEPMRKIFPEIEIIRENIPPNLDAISSSLNNSFLKLKSSPGKTLLKHWVQNTPEGIKGNMDKLELMESSRLLRDSLFPEEYDYIVVDTDISLGSIALGGDLSQVVIAEPDVEKERLKKFLKMFAVASFDINFEKGTLRLRSGYDSFWKIIGNRVCILEDENELLCINSPCHSPYELFFPFDNVYWEEHMKFVREYVYERVIPAVMNDDRLKEHIYSMVSDRYGRGIGKLGLYIQEKIFGLPDAPTDPDHLVENIMRVLAM